MQVHIAFTKDLGSPEVGLAVLLRSFNYLLYTNRPRRLHQCERLIQSMEKAWMIHLPGVNLNEAIRRMENGEESLVLHNDGSVATEEAHEPAKTVPAAPAA